MIFLVRLPKNHRADRDFSLDDFRENRGSQNFYSFCGRNRTPISPSRGTPVVEDAMSLREFACSA